VNSPCGDAYVAWGRSAEGRSGAAAAPDTSKLVDRGVYGRHVSQGLDIYLPTSEDAPGTWWLWIGMTTAREGPIRVARLPIRNAPRHFRGSIF
jgi:hypothetical protein